MKRIRHTLLERWYSYEDARKIAEKSPEYNEFFEVRPGSPFLIVKLIIPQEPLESNEENLNASTGTKEPTDPVTSSDPPQASPLPRSEPGTAPMPG